MAMWRVLAGLMAGFSLVYVFTLGGPGHNPASPMWMIAAAISALAAIVALK